MAKPTTPDRSQIPAREGHQWDTVDEPITMDQQSYLETLLREAGEDIPEDLSDLTKAEAALEIEELERRTGRTPPYPTPTGSPGSDH